MVWPHAPEDLHESGKLRGFSEECWTGTERKPATSRDCTHTHAPEVEHALDVDVLLFKNIFLLPLRSRSVASGRGVVGRRENRRRET